MLPLIEQGFLYIAQPPLYRIQTGRKIDYTYSEEEKDEYLNNVTGNRNPSIQRYKGLGEMNPDQLWDTTMNPEARTFYRVQMGDEEGLAADHIFRQLMGDDVAARRRFIEIHANEVQNLDV